MKIKINNPCPEDWETMQDFTEGKFCEKCSKCVVDFTDKTNDEVQDILNNTNDKEICGRISYSNLFAKTAAGIILITNLTFAQAQITTDNHHATEQHITNVTRLSGKLIFKRTKKEIPNADVFFISKKKYFKAQTDEKGNFILEVPNEFIKRKNVLYFDFGKINEANWKENKRQDTISGYDNENRAVIFSRNEKVEDKRFEIDYEGFEIGAVVIMKDPPPDYYYFNGKSISKKKFEKLKKENPQYQYFSFEGKEAEVIARKDYLDTLRLLYSD